MKCQIKTVISDNGNGVIPLFVEVVGEVVGVTMVLLLLFEGATETVLDKVGAGAVPLVVRD